MDNKYYLAIEVNHNNYFPINLEDIKVNVKNTLKELDMYTKDKTKEEIMAKIQEANILDVNEQMSLVIIYYEKNEIRKIPVLTKDKSYNLASLIKNNYQDKNFVNKIYNFLNNKVDITELKKAKSYEEFIKCLSNIDYLNQRKLYFYLNEN